MLYLKSALAGIAGALIAVVLWIVAVVIMPVLVPYLVSRFTGSGGVATAYVESNSMLAVAAIGFIAGFAWKLRRQRAGAPTK